MKRQLPSRQARKAIKSKSSVRYSLGLRNLALEDTVRQLKSTTDDQKRYIDSLEAQKIDMKLDFDTQIFNI